MPHFGSLYLLYDAFRAIKRAHFLSRCSGVTPTETFLLIWVMVVSTENVLDLRPRPSPPTQVTRAYFLKMDLHSRCERLAVSS